MIAYFFSLLLFQWRINQVSANACEGSSDLFHWRRLGGFFEFEAVLEVCSIQLLGQVGRENFNEDFADCISGTLPYAFDCQVCFAELAGCTIDICIGDCLFVDNRDEDPECRECAETICEPAFTECGGGSMDAAGCDECTRPLGTIIYFIPDFVLIGSIIILPLLCCCCCFVIYRKIYPSRTGSRVSIFEYDKPISTSIERKEIRKAPEPKQDLFDSVYDPFPEADKPALSVPPPRKANISGVDFDLVSEAPQLYRSDRGIKSYETDLTVITTNTKQTGQVKKVSSASPAVALNTMPTATKKKRESETNIF